MSEASDAAAGIGPLTIAVDQDPYLQYQPAFAYSLPIQLFVNGITLTLLAVLLMHLLFTTQYHYPLAPLNYCLQLSSIVTVFISVLVKIWFVLDYSAKSADVWPYDLDYIAVPIPPKSWTIAQDAAWFLLQALNIGLSNIAHIQFLTLLYPSRTEARLIIFILGPLAIASSGLVFTSLSGSQRVLDVSDSIRNVLNSTLLLIFTIAIFIWGCFVNRRRAWRTDGGTAVFGFGAMFLAVVSTTVNFVAVAEDGIDWLQHLLYAAILWQIWLGWWWWVGSGMGIGEVEDLMERAEKKKRKTAKKAARQRALERQPLRRRGSSLAGIVDAGQASANAMVGFTSSVAGILRNRNNTLTRRSTLRSERRSTAGTADEEEGAAAGQGIEMERLQSRVRTRTPQPSESGTAGGLSTDRPARSGTPGGGGTGRVGFTAETTTTPPDSRNGAIQQSTNSETSSTSATPSLHPPRTLGQLVAFPATWLQVYFRRLRRAHEDAARKAALEQVERRQQVFERRDRESRRDEAELAAARAEAALAEGEGTGWGLGSFGIKEHRESAKRLQAARDRLKEDRLLGGMEEVGEAGEADDGDVGGSGIGVAGAGPSTALASAAATERARSGGDGEDDGEGGQRRVREDSEWEDMEEDARETGAAVVDSRTSEERRRSKDKGKARDEGGAAGGDRLNQRVGNGVAAGGDVERGAAGGGPGGTGRPGRAGGTGGPGGTGSWSWWGPLKDWRLNDRSAF